MLEYERVFKGAEKYTYTFRCSAKVGEYDGKVSLDFQIRDVVSKEEIAMEDEHDEPDGEAVMDEEEPVCSDEETTLGSGDDKEEGEEE